MDDSSRHSDYYSANTCFSCFFLSFSDVSAVWSELSSASDHFPVRLSAYSALAEVRNV